LSGLRESAKDPVARFTRAWIETSSFGCIDRSSGVARFTRAWIETHKPTPDEIKQNVARFTRAWIETLS